MTPQEAWRLLTVDSAFSGRPVDKPTAVAWAEVLPYVSLADATAALKAYYAVEKKWMMPAHVTDYVRGQAKALESSTMSPERIDCHREGRVHRWLTDDTCMLCTMRR